MSQVDPSVFRRRRLTALVGLALVITLIWGIPQLLSGTQQAETVEPSPTATAEATSSEVTNCQPGVVEVEAFIGRQENQEPLVNIPAGEPAYLWYEVVNTGLVDCIFDVGSYATFFTITSGDQVYYSSRDCDRSSDSKLSQILKANQPLKSAPAEWLKVYSSSDNQCGPENSPVPKGGAAFDLKVEVSGVVSEKKRFYLF